MKSALLNPPCGLLGFWWLASFNPTPKSGCKDDSSNKNGWTKCRLLPFFYQQLPLFFRNQPNKKINLTLVFQNPPKTFWGGVWNPKRLSQEVFGGPNIHSGGIWKTRVRFYWERSKALKTPQYSWGWPLTFSRVNSDKESRVFPDANRATKKKPPTFYYTGWLRTGSLFHGLL